MKIILSANTDWYLYHFRIAQIMALRDLGADVLLVSPQGPFSERLKSLGYRWKALHLSRSGTNPVTEAASIVKLYRLYRQERPDLVHHFTVKNNLYGSLAARLAGVRCIVNAVTGLGYPFGTGGLRRKLLRSLITIWYRVVLTGTQVIFENEADRRFFTQNRLVSLENAHLVRSAGVDIEKYRPSPEPAGIPVVIFAGRMLWDKGVGELVEAARQLARAGIAGRVVLVGLPDPGNPTSIPEEQLRSWEAEGVVEYWGWREDMPKVFSEANIFCLPSYREGLSTAIIEASACGRPVVATDTTGCRDAVRHGETGLLVPVKDASALAEALGILLQDAGLRKKMGMLGRKMVEAEFSATRVNADTFRVYEYAGLKGLI